MGRELKRLKNRKEIVVTMDSLLDKKDTSLVIHYSCESFYGKTDGKNDAKAVGSTDLKNTGKPDGKTARITSIAVRNLASGQTDSFSVHQIAEEQQIAFDKIPEHYDALERAMLDRYFEFLRTRSNSTFIHWNMRDVNYGFPAIEHRYRVLQGTPLIVAEDRKFDLSRALVAIYGIEYMGHPRLEKLVDYNSIGKRDFLSGKAEADAWDEKQFVKLHQSTLRKVDILANIFERATDRSLKTYSKWYKQYGFTPAVAGEYLKEHWLTSLIGVLAVVAGAIVKGADLYKFFTDN